jgi:hypothetical protein
MMHDLQPPAVQAPPAPPAATLAGGRQPSPYGENEFFRKAVRRHELFWRRDL